VDARGIHVELKAQTQAYETRTNLESVRGRDQGVREAA
jgi:hypothetical protein